MHEARQTIATFFAALSVAVIATASAIAQDKGTLNPKPLPPLANPNDPNTPAKELFGRKAEPAPLAARALGWYAEGCLAGAIGAADQRQTWQVMRLSRNRNWGHPNLVAMPRAACRDRERRSAGTDCWSATCRSRAADRCCTGHASHQVGLDADIWLTPMPERELTRKEREEMSATMMVAADRKDVDPNVWTPAAHRHHQGRGRAARRSSAFSSMPRSRKRFAARPAGSAPG